MVDAVFMTLLESCVSLEANLDSGQSAVSNKSSPRREILPDPLWCVEPGPGPGLGAGRARCHHQVGDPSTRSEPRPSPQ